MGMQVSVLSLPGFSAPSASLEAPLEMLSACHGRVEHQCDTLLRLVSHLAQHGADARAREAINAITRYFEVAAVHHHADEEQDLFPAMLEAMAGSDAVCIRELTNALKDDHARLGHQWANLMQALQRQLQSDLPAVNETNLAKLAEQFVQDYRMHIEREENELLPMAQRLLDDQYLDRIGQSMRKRRGVELP